jgi:hypothetical protein
LTLYNVRLYVYVMSNPPIVLTAKVRTTGADIAVMGDADQLKAAFEAGQPVTLAGKHEGEAVYLGFKRMGYDDGMQLETIGLDRIIGETPKFPGVTIAAYLVDMTRLDDAPKLAELHRKATAARLGSAVKVEARAEAEDERLENLAEDGA